MQEKKNLENLPFVELLPKGSWVERWVKSWRNTAPPRSFYAFTGLALVGAVLGRRVWFDLDAHVTYPMMNLLLIGPSGLGKSTVIKRHGIKALVRPLVGDAQPQIIEGAASPQKLHWDLAIKPHAIIFASELANFFTKEKFMEGMLPYVTELLDYEPVEKRTKTDDVIRIEKPEVTVIGGSTVEWLQDMLPDTAMSGGFLARFVIVKEDYCFQKVADPKRSMGKAAYAEIKQERNEVFGDFIEIIESVGGEMKFADYDASDAYWVWYMNHKPATGALAPFAARAGENVLRLAMLLAITDKRMEIRAEDIEVAKGLYEYAVSRLQEVVVPFSIQGKMMEEILKVLGTEMLTEQQICRAMQNHMAPVDTQKLISGLAYNGAIRKLPSGKYVRARN